MPSPPPPRPRLHAERKLQFVVSVIRACQVLHEGAARAAAAAAVAPVVPYTAHFSLEPASASTRWHTHATSRVERAQPPNALAPGRAGSLPAPGARASSNHIYSVGVPAAVAMFDEHAEATKVRGAAPVFFHPAR